ncbi:MAG TPA: beta-ketoacyl synthase N-terminal-like domain-containing protein [Aldersonia sp.]
MNDSTSILGIGAVTGYGWGADYLHRGLLGGKPAATLLPGYGPNRDEEVWLARVSDEGDPADGPTRFSRAMRHAAREAIADARARGWTPGRRVGLLHAVVLGEVDDWRRFYLEEAGHRGPWQYMNLMPSTPISLVMQEFGFHGPAMSVSSMCSSGNTGLITGKMWLDSGIADDVVVVATDLSLTPENVDHFVRLRAAVVADEPLQVCRPFQEGSQGFAAGEASIAFVVSNRGGDAYTSMLGGAMSHDAFHITSIEPSLTHVVECVGDALAGAKVGPDEVRYLNAHGTGTQQCNDAETRLLDEWLTGASVYSTKPLTGHCQAAAAAVEVAAAALGYEHGVIAAPPIVAAAHPRLLDGATPMDRTGITLKTSLGMGGHNSAVVLGPPRY